MAKKKSTLKKENMSNFSRYKLELEQLVEDGTTLLVSLTSKKNISEFKLKYEAWYSESRKVVAQILPERVSDFEHYYKPAGAAKRKVLDAENYTIRDFLIDIQVRHGGGAAFSNREVVFLKIQQQVFILNSVRKRFERSLFEIKELIQSDLFDSELDQARELNKKGFVRGAGAIAGVVLERHLKTIVKSHKLKVTNKNPTISILNDELKK